MSKISAEFINNEIIIKRNRARMTEKDVEIIPFESLTYGRIYKSSIKIKNSDDKNSIFLLKRIEQKNIAKKNDIAVEDVECLSEEDDSFTVDEEEGEDDALCEDRVIIIYSSKDKIMYSYCSIEKAYKSLLKFKYKVLKLSLSKRKLKVIILGYFINKYHLDFSDGFFYIDEVIGKPFKIKEYDCKLSKKQMLLNNIIQKFEFSINDIINDDSLINGSVRVEVKVGDNVLKYKVGMRDKRLKKKRYYYAPIKSKYVGKYALHIRRTPKANLVLVKRLKEPIEYTFKFKFMESKIISGALYKISKFLITLRKKSINLYYEKFSEKAEEGAYDLFIKARDNSKESKNYYVIDKNSEDYSIIRNEKNVVKKYSIKYYWLMFNANNFISTEAPIHLNILRSNNAAIRKSQCDKKFIFLQHGITYLKCQGAGSTFAKGKEGQASYIIVGSEKEKDAVVDMLRMQEEQVLNTGLPVFSKIKHKHINSSSEDIITIMLTWKPYEEQLYNFEESTYYKNTIKIYEMLKKYISSEKIVIIPHPKVYDLLANTDMKDSIWLGKISEVLSKTKLLITDYSSVCYNAFYQGAGVIFYQPDLEKYEQENGPLIPNDDEYVGYRAFNMKQLEEIIDYSVKNKKINLNVVRTEEFEKRYKTINEFSDGKNIDRIYSILKDMEII